MCQRGRLSPARSHNLLLGALAAVAMMALGPAMSSAAVKIVFHANRDTGVDQVYVMNPDGSGLQALPTTGVGDINAALSPDGLRVAIESGGKGFYRISSMKLDGSDRRRLTQGPWDMTPRWSPDGARIAYGRLIRFPDVVHVWVMNADGTNPVELTHDADSDWYPDWSPDGRRIVFSDFAGGHYELRVMDTDGTNRQSVTDSPADKHSPRWSPDGTKIAYVSTNPSLSPASIHVVNADGTGDVALTDSTCVSLWPAWSPDGTRIAFQSDRSGVYQIYTMAADGSDVQRVTWTYSADGDWTPSWGVVADPTAIEMSARGRLRLAFGNPMRAGGAVGITTVTAGPVRLKIFDASGRLVRTLLCRSLPAGSYREIWDGKDDAGGAAPSGVYFCHLVNGPAARAAGLVYLR